MGVGLPPLEFTECVYDSPKFRENLHKHERELDITNQQIKRLIKEIKDVFNAAKQLSNSQRSFANCLQGFTFQCIGETQTDDERVISKSLSEFGKLILSIEDERERMLDNMYALVVKPLEEFRKKQIGSVKNEKKKFEKQTAKFCQCQERYLNLTTKKQNSLQEADASVDMAERHFYKASMDYVYLIQEVHERKKFEFVETLLTFLFGWLTFYHQGYEVAKDFRPYMEDLQEKIQRTRTNFDDFSAKLQKRMAEVHKQYLEEPIRRPKNCKEGYLFLLEKKAFGNTWTKHYCKYDKDTKEFSMVPYNQMTTKSVAEPETMVLTSCVRRMSDSIEKRFCFDIQLNAKPGVIFTFQALSEQDRKSWMDIMDGKEPTYIVPNVSKPQNSEESVLDEAGIMFVKKCIEVLETRGLEEQGLYRVVGVTSKVNKLLNVCLDKKKPEKLSIMEDSQEWETKTITSSLKSYLRNLPEPLMTFRYHSDFIAAAKRETRQNRINDVHTLLYRIPKINFEVLKILIKHLSNVAAKSDVNLMTVSNLGVCFGPTLLRPEEETVASIMDLKFYNIVVEILIENYDKIFNSEPDAYYNKTPFHSNVPKYVGVSHIKHNEPTEALSKTEYSKSEHHIPAYQGNNDGTEPLYSNSVRNSYSVSGSHGSSDVPPSLRHAGGAGDYSDPHIYSTEAYYESLGPKNILQSPMFQSRQPYNGNSSYSITRSDHFNMGNAKAVQHRFLQQFTPKISQSESNILSLPTHSPTNLRAYTQLEADSTSSSNESIPSTWKDGSSYTTCSPKKSERSSVYLAYSKGFNKTPGKIRVRTLYACLGENDGELSFEPNQIITNVRSSQEPGWLEGTLNGKTGLIPENYVEILP